MCIQRSLWSADVSELNSQIWNVQNFYSMKFYPKPNRQTHTRCSLPWDEMTACIKPWRSLVVRDQGCIGIIPYMFDCWADPVVQLLLLKSSMDKLLCL